MKARKSTVSLAVTAAIAACAAATLAPPTAFADKKDDDSTGHYMAGDIHNHTTCSDGSISMQKLVSKAVDKQDGTYGLDWFVQAGHGGNGNRNCTLVEDATLATPAYPFVAGRGPTTTWENSGVTVKGSVSGTSPSRNMWRWQSVQEFQYPLIEYLNAYKDKPLFLGIETVAPGHEHTSASVITGQIPNAVRKRVLPVTPGYTALGNANALAQWEYCFDRNDTDTSRGEANQWNCSVPGSANSADPNWNATAQKLVPASGAGVGLRGHAKTIEAIKWMEAFHPNASYYLPTHLERAGPFNPDGNNGFNVEHLRNFNNAAPKIAFGFETQPGHGASDNRGEYQVLRNNFGGTAGQIDSVGGTTYGGTGVYGAWIGGVWDSLLGEGRNYWFFASSDWHNRGMFGPDDRRSSQDFYPGEYQRSYTLVTTKDANDRDDDRDDRRSGRNDRKDRDDSPALPTPKAIVKGMRTGNVFAASGQLIDRLAFVACEVRGRGNNGVERIEDLAIEAASQNRAPEGDQCATMGEKLQVSQGGDIVVAIAVRDPIGNNYSPYSFANPSLAQIGVYQALNTPVLDHIDLIRGYVSGYRNPGAADYAGEWPRNTAWLHADGTTADLSVVPAAAKNVTAAVVRSFGNSASGWKTVRSKVDGTRFLVMSHRVEGRTSQYLRLRGTNLPPAVPFETDANGNPLADLYTNANDTTKLRIPCNTVGSSVPANGTTFTGKAIDGCPAHLPVVNGQKYAAYDVAAWADLWFYSNPIYIEVKGSTRIAGVK